MGVNLLPLVVTVCTGELSLTLPVLPWHSMVAARCQKPLNVISFGASSIPLLHRICRCLPKDLGKACAHSFCVTFVSRGRQAILPSTFGFMTSARIVSPCFTSWDSRRALLRSPPDEFDCHAPSNRGSYRPCITMYSTLACPRYTCHHHPCTHNAWCPRRLGPELSSCCRAAASVFKVEQHVFERCETGH